MAEDIKKPARQPTVVPSEDVDGGRRQAMKKMGKYAAYTAPTMMVLMSEAKARPRPLPGSP
jgi:hypothetical protein